MLIKLSLFLQLDITENIHFLKSFYRPRNQLTYKDSDYRGQQGVGDQIMFIILGN
nr:MAG TPA: hypothetical protein [Caudoviricetes sp.]